MSSRTLIPQRTEFSEQRPGLAEQRPGNLRAISFVLLTSIGSLSLAMSLALPLSANEPVAQDADRSANSNGDSASNADAEGAQGAIYEGGENYDDESPALGVIVGSCPGNAVCVKGTVWGSPAAQAGIESGDYILSLDGKPVSSPSKLREIVRTMPAGQEVSIKVWRNGRESDQKVMLASKADKPPESHRAWLGVSLSPGHDQPLPSETNQSESEKKSAGIVIEHVYPGSPADEAGLRDGDTIAKVGGQSIAGVEQFVEAVENHAPDSQLPLQIRRDGQERDMTVRLGSMEEAPMGFFRQALLPLFDESEMQKNNRRSDDRWMIMLEDAVDEMRSELRELREEVEELHIEKDGQKQKTSHVEKSSQTVFVAQRNRGRGFRYGNSLGYGRGYQGRNWYGNNWNQLYNQRLLFPPIYSSPFYGNSYYNYGGRPYYYGGYGRNYGYGLRSGIQLGRGLGSYWY